MATKKILADLDLRGKIEATGAVSGSNLSGTNTGDQTLTGLNYATTAQGVLSDNSVQLNGNQTIDGVKSFNSVIKQEGENVATEIYVQSRGENLVTNGTALLDSNKNFSGFIFDSSEAFYSGGSFKVTSGSITRLNDELLPVNPELTYKLSYYIKWAGTTYPRHYGMIVSYDVDGNTINPTQTMRRHDDTLSQPLNVGDTKVYVNDISSWDDTGGPTYNRAILMFGYKNSKGYTYPDYTYSRFFVNGAYAQNAGFGSDSNGDYIILNSPWAIANPEGGAWAIGSAISQGSAGGTYKYIAGANALTTTEWVNYSGFMGGVDLLGNNTTNKFHPGTAFIKVGWLLNRNATSSETSYISTVSFGLSFATEAQGVLADTAYGWGNHAGLYATNSHSHTFASLTSKPTTISGYGITDLSFALYKGSNSADWNGISYQNGIYRLTGNTNNPFGVHSTLLSIGQETGQSYGFQLANGTGVAELQFRGFAASGSFYPWYNIYHDGNLDPANFGTAAQGLTADNSLQLSGVSSQVVKGSVRVDGNLWASALQVTNTVGLEFLNGLNPGSSIKTDSSNTVVIATRLPGAPYTETKTLFVTNAGYVGVGDPTPSYELDVAGKGRYTGDLRALSFITTSQSDTKRDIVPISKTTGEKILFKSFKYKNEIDGSNRKRYGVLAEDIQAEYPELVHVGADGKLGVNYVDLLIKRVAELEQELEDATGGATITQTVLVSAKGATKDLIFVNGLLQEDGKK